MRKDFFFPWPGGWALFSVISISQVGCRSEGPAPLVRQPPASAASHPSASSAPVPLEETFSLSNVQFHYDEQRERLIGSYTVRNRTSAHAGASLCIDLIDKDGYFIKRAISFDLIALRAGDFEQVEESDSVDPLNWAATTVLRIYMLGTTGFCPENGTDFRSAVLFMDNFGRPLPPESRPVLKTSEAESEMTGKPWFELKNARLSQDSQGKVLLSYGLTQHTQGRAASTLCARLLENEHCLCKGMDQAESREFNLGRGESVRWTWHLDLQDNTNWSRGRQLLVYMSELGCALPPEEATSNVLLLPKPNSIQAPMPSAEEEFDEGE